MDRALQIDPNFILALEGPSETAYRSRDRRAVAYLERLLRREPAIETAHAMAAVLAFEARDCPAAVTHSERSRRQIESNEPQFGHCLL